MACPIWLPLFSFYFQMNQNWAQKSILAWFWHHFHHLVYWMREDSNPQPIDRESNSLTTDRLTPMETKFYADLVCQNRWNTLYEFRVVYSLLYIVYNSVIINELFLFLLRKTKFQSHFWALALVGLAGIRAVAAWWDVSVLIRSSQTLHIQISLISDRARILWGHETSYAIRLWWWEKIGNLFVQ